MLGPAPNPRLHSYVLAPEADNTLDSPVQIVAGAADVLTVGRAFTVTVTVAVFVQPLAAVPVTVYVVVATGVTVLVAPVPNPWLHSYVLAPEAVITLDSPAQIVAGAADAETKGKAFTVTVIVAVFVQLLAAVPVTV